MSNKTLDRDNIYFEYFETNVSARLLQSMFILAINLLQVDARTDTQSFLLPTLEVIGQERLHPGSFLGSSELENTRVPYYP